MTDAAAANRARVELDQDRELAAKIGKELYQDHGKTIPAKGALERGISDAIARRSWVSSRFGADRIRRLKELAKEELEIIAGRKDRVVPSERRERTPLVPPDELPPELRPGLQRKKALPKRLAKKKAAAPPRRKPPPARSIPAGPAPAPKQTPKEKIMARAADGHVTIPEWLRREIPRLVSEGFTMPDLAAELIRRALDEEVTTGSIRSIWNNYARSALKEAELDTTGVNAVTIKASIAAGIEDPSVDDDDQEEPELEEDAERRRADRRVLEGTGPDDVDRRCRIQRQGERMDAEPVPSNEVEKPATPDLDPRGVLAAAEGVTVDELEERDGVDLDQDSTPPVAEDLPFLPSSPFGDPWPDVERKCVVCGCTDLDCSECIDKTGVPCEWALAGADGLVCSRCASDAVELLLENRDVDPESDGPQPGPTVAYAEREWLTPAEVMERFGGRTTLPDTEELALAGPWGHFLLRMHPNGTREEGAAVDCVLVGGLDRHTADELAALVLKAKYGFHHVVFPRSE